MVRSITPENTRNLLDSQKQAAMIDIRQPIEYSQGHIRESTLVSCRRLEYRLPKVVPNREATVILCDQNKECAPGFAAWIEFLGYSDVRYLDGGMDTWESVGFDTVEIQHGVYNTAFNYPSKVFGEKVLVEEQINKISPIQLRQKLDDDDVMVVDIRTPEEHRTATIPGAVNIEGVDIGLYLEQVRDDDQTVITHCTGRTRSIIATATLEKLGLENVYELENGTRGWELAGYELEQDADRHIRAVDTDEQYRRRLDANVKSFLEEKTISQFSVAEFRNALDDPNGVVYPVDVRTGKEYEAGHIPNTLSISGGQAIQKADEHFAVRNGLIIFISNNRIRSTITASWFDEMGFPNVAVLEPGLNGWKDANLSIENGPERREPLERASVENEVTYISSEELEKKIGSGETVIVNISHSDDFKTGHIPGAKWVPRYNLAQWLTENHRIANTQIVIYCQEDDYSTYAVAAAQDTLEYANMMVLRGGVTAWKDSGRRLEEGTRGMEFQPQDKTPRPEQQGDWAKKAYLAWEEKLGEQFE